jgi:hypothetical protein
MNPVAPVGLAVFLTAAAPTSFGRIGVFGGG